METCIFLWNNNNKKKIHCNKDFIEKHLPDSRQTLLSNEKGSCWVGNTDLQVCFHIMPISRSSEEKSAGKQQHKFAVTWAVQLRAGQLEQQQCAGWAMGLCGSWHYVIKLSKGLPQHGLAYECAPLTRSVTCISLRVWCGNLRSSLGFYHSWKDYKIKSTVLDKV